MNRRNNGPKVTKDELDKEMDDYMANTKSFLEDFKNVNFINAGHQTFC